MSPKEIERAAYIAAHRLLAVDTTARELVCPGARRTHAVDIMAQVIREAFELQKTPIDESGYRFQYPADAGPHPVELRRTGVLVELPLRASS